MSQIEHNVIAFIICTALWHLFIKQYFVTKKDVKVWEKIIKRFFLS